MKVLLSVLCVALAITQLILPAVAQESPPRKVITDRSTLNESSVDRSWPDNAGNQGPAMPRATKGKRWELVLGLVAMGALLVYGLFRWQARTSRRSL